MRSVLCQFFLRERTRHAEYICIAIKSIFISGREYITKIWFDVGTQWPFWKVTFFIVRTVLRGTTSISDRTNLQYITRSRNLIYQTWPEQKSLMYLRRLGLSIVGTPLDQCCWNVFDLICEPLKYKFGYQKCIYIAGLEIEISRKLYLMYGHGGHLEKIHFVIVGTLSESDTQSNIFFLYKIPQNKIN